jgi:hypothetical protein
MTDEPDINDTMRREGIDSVRRRHDTAEKYNGGPHPSTKKTHPKQERPAAAAWKYYTGEPSAPLRWLIKSILAEAGTALISGQWGTFKTTIALEIAVSVMTTLPFAGRYRVKRRGAVLFIALEGAGALAARLEAIAKHHGVEGPLPFAWRDDCPALTDDEAVEVLCALVDQAKADIEKSFDLPIVLIVIDTVITAAQHKEGGDNDTAASQKVMRVMRGLSKHAGALVVGIDHFGKVVDTGTRGSSAKEGAADAVLALLADRELNGSVKNTRLAIRKQRDGVSGFEIPFNVRTIETGLDEDGDPITSQVIDWAAPQQTAAGANDPRWTKSMQLLRRILMSELADHGRNARPFEDGSEVRACDIELVRDEFHRQHHAEGAPQQKHETRKKAFNRALKTSKERNVIATREVAGVQLIWLIKPEAQLP